MNHRDTEIEDGMGLAGLVPTTQEKLDERREAARVALIHKLRGDVAASQSRVERLEAALQKILGQTSVHMRVDDAPKVLRDDLNIINLHCLQALTNDAGEGA